MCLGPPGDLSWASEHMPAFFDSLNEEVLKEVLDSDGNYVLEVAQYHFTVASWKAGTLLVRKKER